jgi:hypothetical protein
VHPSGFSLYVDQGTRDICSGWSSCSRPRRRDVLTIVFASRILAAGLSARSAPGSVGMGRRCFFPGASTMPPLRPRVLLGAGPPVRVLTATGGGASAVSCWSSSAAPSRTRASSFFSPSPSIQPAVFACTVPAIRPSCSANSSTRCSSPSTLCVPGEVIGAVLVSPWGALAFRLVICLPSFSDRHERTAVRIRHLIRVGTRCGHRAVKPRISRASRGDRVALTWSRPLAG